MLYRIEQFINAIRAKITPEDRAFYKKYLTLKEVVLFEKLKVYDQKHCIKVAQLLQQEREDNKEIIRLGLLHDIGKIAYPLNPIKKAIIVSLDYLSKGKIKKYRQFKIIRAYYEHAQIGYELLKAEGGYSEEFLNGIKSHHSSKESKKETFLYLLQEADNKA